MEFSQWLMIARPDSTAAIAAAAITLRSCSPGGSFEAILMAPGLMPVEPIPLRISWR